MQNLFDEVTSLDRRCYEMFHLTEDLLMEHAGDGMAKWIQANFPQKSKIIIITGSGNNGADGMALARLLYGLYEVSILIAKAPKSPMALLQKKRIDALGIPTIKELTSADIVIDATVGTGFQGELTHDIEELFKDVTRSIAFKIACDVPSGLQGDGNVAKGTFQADVTLTMGGVKKSLFLDEAKDFVGKIEVINLGIARQFYERESSWKLLEFQDLKLPQRRVQNSHKGSFGHLTVLSGQKSGASILSAQSALRFGVGLVTLLCHESLSTPYEIMQSTALPQNTTAIALGMGLGESFREEELLEIVNNTLPLVLDADIFTMPLLIQLLQRNNIVLTPHPKEFVSLLKITKLANITVEELQKRRFEFVTLFCKAYPQTVLLLKGANVIIGKNDKFFINPYGSAKLAKGGSGDVLAGLIASLVAQGYKSLDATITASLAHTKIAKNYLKADFSLTPTDLIEGIANIY